MNAIKMTALVIASAMIASTNSTKLEATLGAQLERDDHRFFCIDYFV